MDDNWGHRCASNLLILQQEVKKEREREMKNFTMREREKRFLFKLILFYWQWERRKKPTSIDLKPIVMVIHLFTLLDP